jgi:hypothetical protein
MFDKSLDYKSYFQHEWVISTAKEIASYKSKDDDRTLDEKLVDATNGCAVQYAVFEHLKEKDLNVEHAPEDRKEYDLVIRFGDKTIHADVKGIFKQNTKYFGQTPWEKENVPKLGFPVYYLCFDCKSGEGIYRGWCTDKDFLPSKFNKGTYTFTDKLKVGFP